MSDYREAIIQMRGTECELCESVTDLLVHHIDGDRQNDSLDNLLVVCNTCHAKIHTSKNHGEKWDQLTEQLPESSLTSGTRQGNQKRTTVSIMPDQHQWVKSNNINLSELVREAIDRERLR